MNRGASVEPFKRDSTDVKPHGKRWQNVEAGNVREGDLLAEYGEVVRTIPGDGGDPSVGLVTKATHGRTLWFRPDEEVHIFR